MSSESVRHTLGADAHLVLRVILQETLNTAAGELFQRGDESVMAYYAYLPKKKREKKGLAKRQAS